MTRIENKFCRINALRQADYIGILLILIVSEDCDLFPTVSARFRPSLEFLELCVQSNELQSSPFSLQDIAPFQRISRRSSEILFWGFAPAQFEHDYLVLLAEQIRVPIGSAHETPLSRRPAIIQAYRILGGRPKLK